jgi:hypothetical protein
MIPTSWIIFGIIAVITLVVVWKWWKNPKTSEAVAEVIDQKLITQSGESPPPTDTGGFGTPPPPMVFAVNDDGNFDLSDMSGKLLNVGFGPNPKTYINLLDQAEKDIVKSEGGQMTSGVGTTKLYEVGGRQYIVNFTRLS